MDDSCDELYCEIGRVAVAWAKIECLLVFGISHFSGISLQKAQCMFSGQNAYGKMSALECLLGEACEQDIEFCQGMGLLMQRIDDARITRNDFQHCEVGFDGINVKLKSVKKSKGPIVKIKETLLTLKEIQLLAVGIQQLEADLRDFLSEASIMILTED